MRYKKDKNIKFVITRFVFSSSKCSKIRSRPGLRSGPRLGSLRHSPDPLVGWRGGYPLLIPTKLGAYGASVLRPPQHKILATPVAATMGAYAVWVRHNSISYWQSLQTWHNIYWARKQFKFTKSGDDFVKCSKYWRRESTLYGSGLKNQGTEVSTVTSTSALDYTDSRRVGGR